MGEFHVQQSKELQALTDAVTASVTRIATLEGRRAEANAMADRTAPESDAHRLHVTQRSEAEAGIAGERAKLTELRARISELQGGPVMGVPTMDVSPVVVFPGSTVFGLSKDEAVFVGSLAVLLPLALAAAMIFFRRFGRTPRPMAAEDDRIARIERAVESVAIEVERIGESQRFQTKLMSEQGGDRANVEVRR